MSRTDASRINPARYVPTRFFELAKIAASGRLGQQWGVTFVSFDDAEVEKIGLHVGRHVFEAKALRLIGLARAAIIYLCLAVHREESLKKDGSPKTISVPMLTDTWDDKWKV